jgi:isopentenyldiphosphate isomerase
MAEYFDIYDALGMPTGARKRRDLVHRDGDWHRSVALWIVRHDGRLVLQRRSMTKDTRPGLLTASVSGHYAAGEELTDVLREAREEIGISVTAEMLTPLGVWRFDDNPSPELVDRELQDVFLWPLDLPLDLFKPDPAEVSGLSELWPDDLEALARGQVTTIQGTYVGIDQTGETTVMFAPSEFVPHWQYYRRISRAAREFAARAAPDHTSRPG